MVYTVRTHTWISWPPAPGLPPRAFRIAYPWLTVAYDVPDDHPQPHGRASAIIDETAPAATAPAAGPTAFAAAPEAATTPPTADGATAFAVTAAPEAATAAPTADGATAPAAIAAPEAATTAPADGATAFAATAAPADDGATARSPTECDHDSQQVQCEESQFDDTMLMTSPPKKKMNMKKS